MLVLLCIHIHVYTRKSYEFNFMTFLCIFLPEQSTVRGWTTKYKAIPLQWNDQ